MATNAVKAAQAGRDQAAIRLSRAVIRAPFPGRVASVPIELGESVGPGSPVARLVQLDPAVVDLTVSDRDVVALEDGTAPSR